MERQAMARLDDNNPEGESIRKFGGLVIIGWCVFVVGLLAIVVMTS